MNTIKQCEKCGKDFISPHFNSRFCCKECRTRAFLDKNKEKRRLLQREWRSKCPEKMAQYAKEKREKNAQNPRRIKLSDEERKRRGRAQREQYRKEHLEQIAKYHREWVKNNKEKQAEFHKKYFAKRYYSDPQYRMRAVLRRRFSAAIKNRLKGGSAVYDLGCSIEDFVKYIENLFEPWMNWGNYGRYCDDKLTWQLDHIMPLVNFDLTDPMQVKIACNYKNLRPLRAIDNLKRGKKGL
jgi:type I site-specific restriction endonuclease